MGWSGSITSSSAVGSSITFTPNTSTEGAYEVSSFTAPKKGVYEFLLNGSGGTNGLSAGGNGGNTVGYLLLNANQTVYVGAGGTCSAAFVSSVTGLKLSNISKGNLYFVAGAGGAGGNVKKGSADDYHVYAGGNGGGNSGATAPEGGAGGGTQSSGGAAYVSTSSKVGNGANGAYGTGGAGGGIGYSNGYAYGGRGGDGYYGGAGGYGRWHDNDMTGDWGLSAYGGGGGSGYVYSNSLTVKDVTYTSSTTQGYGAAAGGIGNVTVTYYARAELPITFNGQTIEKIEYNGVEIDSLWYNGTQLF